MTFKVIQSPGQPSSQESSQGMSEWPLCQRRQLPLLWCILSFSQSRPCTMLILTAKLARFDCCHLLRLPELTEDEVALAHASPPACPLWLEEAKTVNWSKLALMLFSSRPILPLHCAGVGPRSVCQTYWEAHSNKANTLVCSEQSVTFVLKLPARCFALNLPLDWCVVVSCWTYITVLCQPLVPYLLFGRVLVFRSLAGLVPLGVARYSTPVPPSANCHAQHVFANATDFLAGEVRLRGAPRSVQL